MPSSDQHLGPMVHTIFVLRYALSGFKMIQGDADARCEMSHVKVPGSTYDVGSGSVTRVGRALVDRHRVRDGVRLHRRRAPRDVTMRILRSSNGITAACATSPRLLAAPSA